MKKTKEIQKAIVKSKQYERSISDTKFNIETLKELLKKLEHEKKCLDFIIFQSHFL